jgi:hypothetical protein
MQLRIWKDTEIGTRSCCRYQNPWETEKFCDWLSGVAAMEMCCSGHLQENLLCGAVSMVNDSFQMLFLA